MSRSQTLEEIKADYESAKIDSKGGVKLFKRRPTARCDNCHRHTSNTFEVKMRCSKYKDVSCERDPQGFGHTGKPGKCKDCRKYKAKNVNLYLADVCSEECFNMFMLKLI